jgi:hypothetical protein
MAKASTISLENATILVANRLIQENYITAFMVGGVYLSVNGKTQPDTLAIMSTIIKTAAVVNTARMISVS